jgi:uncharacterized membrane protein
MKPNEDMELAIGPDTRAGVSSFQMDYLISFLVLIAAIVLFFTFARGQYNQRRILQLVFRVLVALPLVLSAIALHFLQTNLATSMIPPGPSFVSTHFLVISTGVLEILGALGLFVPATRHLSALGIAVLMVLVFPANVHVAGQTIGSLTMPSVPVRLAMQVVFIWLALLAGYGFPRLTHRAAKP